MESKKSFIVMLVILLIVIISSVYGNDKTANNYTGTVVKVVDGDTLKLSVAGVINRYRLAGIDTPESYNNVKAQKDIKSCNILDYKYLHLGLVAKEYLLDKYKVGDKINFIIVGVGKYKRSIIYIKGLNESIVSNGLAVVKNYHNLSKTTMYSLRIMQREAKEKKIGIWRYLDTECY